MLQSDVMNSDDNESDEFEASGEVGDEKTAIDVEQTWVMPDGTHFLCHFCSTRCRADGTSTHRKTANMDSVTTFRQSGRLVGLALSF